MPVRVAGVPGRLLQLSVNEDGNMQVVPEHSVVAHQLERVTRSAGRPRHAQRRRRWARVPDCRMRGMTVEEAERILGPELTAQIRATTPRPPLSHEEIIRATALFLEEAAAPRARRDDAR
jgi:hypothetical protein